MKKLTLLLLCFLCAGAASAQEKYYFPATKGAELTYKYYNQRGKALKDQWKKERWMKFVVEDVWPQDNGMVINVGVGNEVIERLAGSKSLAAVAENMAYGDVKIEGDSVTLDNMQWVADVVPEMFSYISSGREEGPTFGVTLTALSSFPRNMQVGDVLPDENILDAKYEEIVSEEVQAERQARMKEMEAEFMAMAPGFGRMGSMPTSFSISAKAQTRNRKVEAMETVQTPAGSFECYKITYELVIPNSGFGLGMRMIHVGPDGMMMGDDREPEPEGIKYADWISPEVGLVKREKYNNRGKLQEMMRLESYKK